VKAWVALKFDLDDGRASSILLTVLVADAAKALGNSGIGADDETLRDILEKIIERLEDDTEVLNPVDKSENLARMTDAQMTTFIDRLKIFFAVAQRATVKTEELAVADVWQESFEHLFPMPRSRRQSPRMRINFPSASSCLTSASWRSHAPILQVAGSAA